MRIDRNGKKWIIWTGNNIEDEGAKMISESLKINTALTKLNLHSDEIEIYETKEYKYKIWNTKRKKRKRKINKTNE